MLIITQLDTFLSFKITFLGHSNSPVKAVTAALSAPSDLKKKKKKQNPTFTDYSFVNYKAYF